MEGAGTPKPKLFHNKNFCIEKFGKVTSKQMISTV